MRRAAMLALLIALAPALGGCTFGGSGDEPAESTQTTTPAPSPGSPTPSPTPSSPTPATPTPNASAPTNASSPANGTKAPTPNASAEPEGIVVLNASFDYSTGEAFVPLKASDTFDVPAGYDRVVVNVTFLDKDTPQPTDRDCSVGMVPPTMVVPIATVGGNGGTSGGMSSTATPGTWTLRYDGQGPVEALVVVRLLPAPPPA